MDILRYTQHRFVSRGQRINSIAAISTDGVVSYELYSQTIRNFYDFLRGNLIPNMLPFDGSNHISILIMDNVSFHHSDIITKLQDAGILTIWLPPYRPDYNPIEEAFSYVKYY